MIRRKKQTKQTNTSIVLSIYKVLLIISYLERVKNRVQCLLLKERWCGEILMGREKIRTWIENGTLLSGPETLKVGRYLPAEASATGGPNLQPAQKNGNLICSICWGCGSCVKVAIRGCISPIICKVKKRLEVLTCVIKLADDLWNNHT